MPLKIQKIPTIKVNQEFLVPGDLGRHTKADLTFEFERVPLKEFTRVVKGETEDEGESMLQYALEKLKNVEGLQDESGEEVAFDESVHTDLIENEDYIADAMIKAFWIANSPPQKKDSKRKN